MTRVMLAYSGALADSLAIPWLAERYGAEVVAVTMDLGQPKEKLEEVRDRALATGALRAHVVDARDIYLRDIILRGLRAGMLWHGGASMAAMLAIPLIAEKLVEIARIEHARTVAHADAEGTGAPIHRVLRAIDPSLDVKAPAGEWAMTAEQQVAYAHERHLLLPAEMSGGVAVRAPGACPDEPALVDVTFERGTPIAINRVIMSIADLVASLEILTTAHGVREAAFGALHRAHASLQQSVLSPHANEFSDEVASQYIRVLREGSWFAPLRQALDAYTDVVQQRVSGVVRLKLFKGECEVASAEAAPLQPAAIALTRVK
ncbi:MAG TPA: argininosuccinate synthase domain-containing protein [Vicinamibacterales bacterium]|nr:argininosuccinate synthase domain-containing protein [Vicinamibacterales bacterium]